MIPVNRSPISSFPTFCVQSCIPTSLSISSSYTEPSFPYERHPTQALLAHSFTHPLQLHAETDQNFHHISTLLSKTAISPYRCHSKASSSKEGGCSFLRHCGPSSPGLQFSCMIRAKVLQCLETSTWSIKKHRKLQQMLSALFRAPQDPFLSYRFPSKLVPFSS
jgi:hypothetical protein